MDPFSLDPGLEGPVGSPCKQRCSDFAASFEEEECI